jgi:hypothetical protein
VYTKLLSVNKKIKIKNIIILSWLMPVRLNLRL